MSAPAPIAISHRIGTTFRVVAAAPSGSAFPGFSEGTVVASLRRPPQIEVARLSAFVSSDRFTLVLPVADQADLVPGDYVLHAEWRGPAPRNLVVPFAPVAIRMFQQLVPEASPDDGPALPEIALMHVSVLSRSSGAPPPDPSAGDAHIVAAPASGAWAGWQGDIAVWNGAEWERLSASDGWLAWVADEAALVVRSGDWLPVVQSVPGSAQFQDTAFLIANSAQPTRRVAFSAGSVSVGATRTFVWPDQSSEVAILAGAQTFTGPKTFAAPLSASGGLTVSGPLTLPSGSVARGAMSAAPPLSVVGRSVDTPGVPGDIAAGSNHQVLRRSGSALAFGAVALDQSAAVSGVLPVANGGTGGGTVSAALAALGVLAGRVQELGAATTLAASDRGKALLVSGTWTLGLPAVASAGAGWSALAINTGGGVVTLDPAGSETVNGALTMALPAGMAALAVCTGSAWQAVVVPGTAAVVALGGVVPAANKLPYFTGASAAALADLTAFGRSLIDDADAAAARATLGLGTAATQTVTTSATDTTVGRLLKVGDFGNTGSVHPPESTDLNAETGVHKRVRATSGGITANSPDSSLAWVVDCIVQGAVTIQVAWSQHFNGTPTMAVRYYNGSWTDWNVHYSRRNLVGTVSQSSGIPTGAVFERNGNANGRWWRTADGMQRCARDDFVVAGVTTADGGVYRSASVTWTFPQAFVSPPVPRFAVLDNQCWAVVESTSRTAVTFRVLSTVSKAAVRLSCEAIGRWFATGAASLADLFGAGEKGYLFDFTDPATLFTDSARTTPVSGSGAQIGGVTDLSGNGNHAGQSVSTKRPVWTVTSSGRAYVQGDGVDDFLSIASLDMTGTDEVTIFAAFRKLSDASLATVLEHSTNADTTAGTFGVNAPNAASSNTVALRSGGSASVVRAISSLAAPISLCVVGRAKISAPSITVARQGALDTGTTTSSQGSGNYTAQAHYLLSRAGTSRFFGGEVTAVGAIGRLLSDTDTLAVMEILNQKSGAY